uniref:SAYSvFN domain-containing protein 1-like n=1 Tax=Phallusia mammillata TaxID=59560 RepID=A0A6F9DR01_9ASCI|nr:SAYSvFN domain-containing protein 1-like [Phallusia mammillata]
MMEQRLAEYRARKHAEFGDKNKQFARPLKTTRPNAVYSLLSKWTNKVISSQLFKNLTSRIGSIPVIGTPFVLKTLLWIIIFLLFVELQFGMVYVIVSAFVFIYFNTSTRRRNREEMSAYSVFNKDCERLDGTFTAEQFEKELRHQPL